jgi:ADP-heptose:LPS heptosyltransferase
LATQLRKESFSHIYDAHNNSRSWIICTLLRPWGPLSLSHFIRRSIRRWQRLLLFQFRINLFEQPFSGQRDLLEPLKAWGISKVPPNPPQLFFSEQNLSDACQLLANFEGAVALAPSAAHELKRWPMEYWCDLIRLNANQKFVLLGGPEDQFLESIRAAAPDRVLNLAGRSSLLVSAAVVARSPVLVSNDTGLLHVAEQLGKPVLALMGPAPFGFPCRPKTVVLERHLACRPCSKHGQGPCVNKKFYHECLRDISPIEVSLNLQKLLAGAR